MDYEDALNLCNMLIRFADKLEAQGYNATGDSDLIEIRRFAAIQLFEAADKRMSGEPLGDIQVPDTLPNDI